jgi:hypothetical protein
MIVSGPRSHHAHHTHPGEGPRGRRRERAQRAESTPNERADHEVDGEATTADCDPTIPQSSSAFHHRHHHAEHHPPTTLATRPCALVRSSCLPCECGRGAPSPGGGPLTVLRPTRLALHTTRHRFREMPRQPGSPHDTAAIQRRDPDAMERVAREHMAAAPRGASVWPRRRRSARRRAGHCWSSSTGGDSTVGLPWVIG